MPGPGEPGQRRLSVCVHCDHWPMLNIVAAYSQSRDLSRTNKLIAASGGLTLKDYSHGC